jgi:hypothetical protein
MTIMSREYGSDLFASQELTTQLPFFEVRATPRHLFASFTKGSGCS